MNMATIAMEVLLAIAVISALLSTLGMVLMKDFFERLHYMSTLTTISSFCLLMAVVIEEGWGQATIKMCLIFLILLVTNAVLTHATARGAWIHTFGRWPPDPDAPLNRPSEVRKRMSRQGKTEGA
jgi:multicomponent Na+:H+ antiporter subunit G